MNIPINPVLVPVVLTVVVWTIVHFVLKKRPTWSAASLQRVESLVLNTVLVGFLVWKLSPLLFRFTDIIRAPLSLLYLSGGRTGLVLGGGAAVIFLGISLLRSDRGKGLAAKTGRFMALFLLIGGVAFGGVYGGLALAGYDSEVPVAKGAAAPDIELLDGDGFSYRLSRHRGQYVVLNFWASWCPPCRAEMPEFVTFFEEYDPDKVFLFSINLFGSERNPDALPEFIEEFALTFPITYDRDGRVARLYGVESLPTTVVVGPDGVILARRTGVVALDWLRRHTSD